MREDKSILQFDFDYNYNGYSLWSRGTFYSLSSDNRFGVYYTNYDNKLSYRI